MIERPDGLVLPPGLVLPDGAQAPRILAVPPFVSSSGQEAIEVARLAGLDLDGWQEFVLAGSLGEDEDGNWSAFEVGLVASRQNGKGGIIEGRELAGLFAFGERLMVHSAHLFDTSLEAFRRLLELIESTPDFDRRVKRVSRAHGDEGIELKGGQRVRFRARTKSGGRGLSGDVLFLDEAMILAEATHGTVLPMVSARPNPQVWYTGTPPDKREHDDAVVFARVRERAIRGDDPALAYFEYSNDRDTPDDVEEQLATDPEAWARANPALDIRITREHIAREQRSMSPRNFAIERLGVGDWPATNSGGKVISDATWKALADAKSKPVGQIAFGVAVPRDRSSAVIAIAGRRADGRPHVELADRRRGTTWVAERVKDMLAKHDALGVTINLAGPAGSLEPEFRDQAIAFTPVSAREYAQACGRFYDSAHADQKDNEGEERDELALRHLGTPDLAAAVRGAEKTAGDAWVWSRKSAGADISPLEACTLALWGLETLPPKGGGRVAALI